MYVVLEGIDTCGKSTQIKALQHRFANHSNIIFTREPGGALNPLGGTIRDMVLKQNLSKQAEFFLFLADRAEHINSVIKPNSHMLIISDRSLISGVAYGCAITNNHNEAIAYNLLSTQGIIPDMCFLFTIDEASLRSRLQAKAHDMIEQRGISYLLDIQACMEHLANPSRKPALTKRAIIIDASLPQATITDIIYTNILSIMPSIS